MRKNGLPGDVVRAEDIFRAEYGPFFDFPEVDKKRISSTNGQERLNMEIRRRSRVVGVFPSVESYVRLTICYLVEYSEDWTSERSYIREDKVLGSLDRLHELMAQAAN